MAFRLLAQPLKRVTTPLASRSSSSVPTKYTIGPEGFPTEHHIYGTKIGTREIVGHGWNSFPTYADRNDYPFPAIRWREETPDIKVSKLTDAKINLGKQCYILISDMLLVFTDSS